MAIYRNLDLEPGDEYCGIFKIKQVKKEKKLGMPDIGEKCNFKIKTMGKRHRSFNGIVVEKYGENHILVKNLKSGIRESFFFYDIKCKDVVISPIND